MSRYSVNWNEFSSNITQYFSQLRSNNHFSDVTLVGDDEQLAPAHKVVITAGSKYFETILRNNQMSHQIICLQGIVNNELNLILDYLYHGEIKIDWDKIDRFLELAQRLKLHGFWKEKNVNLLKSPEKQSHEFDCPSRANVGNVIQSTAKSVIKPPHKDDNADDDKDVDFQPSVTPEKSKKVTEIEEKETFDKSIKKPEQQPPFNDDEAEKEGGDLETRTLSVSSRHTINNEELEHELMEIEFIRNDNQEPNIDACKKCDKKVQQFYEAKWHYEKHHQNLDAERAILMNIDSYIKSMRGAELTTTNSQTFYADIRNKINILKDIDPKKLNPTLQIKHHEIKQWLESRVYGLHN